MAKIIINGDTVELGGTTSIQEYDTEETRIGTWMGNPLYRKVIETTFVAANNQEMKQIILDDFSKKNIKNAFGIVCPKLWNDIYVLPIFSNTSKNRLNLIIRDGKLQLCVTWDSPHEFSVSIAVEYTKTTD